MNNLQINLYKRVVGNLQAYLYLNLKLSISSLGIKTDGVTEIALVVNFHQLNIVIKTE